MNGADLLCQTLAGNGIDMYLLHPGTAQPRWVAAFDRRPGIGGAPGLFFGTDATTVAITRAALLQRRGPLRIEAVI